jgi:D-glutamate cyclase
MASQPELQALVDDIERLVQSEVGRNIAPLAKAARGGLWSAAASLAAAQPCRVGIITGFFVPGGSPPAAETDGPVGAALLARGFAEIGIAARLATDTPCHNACAAALAAAGVAATPLDTVAIGDRVELLIAAWRAAGITHALAIERCGQSADGSPRNMRGEDIGAYTVPFDPLFAAGLWDTIGIGDGGNEIGMGALPRAVVAVAITHGETIACVTPARHLIVAGVSHWGAYALLGAVALLQPKWRRSLLACLDPTLDRAILAAMLRDGPAVDGVSRRQAPTIDNFELAFHHQKLTAIRRLVEAAPAI